MSPSTPSSFAGTTGSRFATPERLPSSRFLRARAHELRQRARAREDSAAMEPLSIAMRRYAAELELLAAVLDAPPSGVHEPADRTERMPAHA